MVEHESYRGLALWNDLLDDLQGPAKGSPSHIVMTLLFSPRFHALALYRLSRWAALNRLGFVSVPLCWLQHLLTGGEISPKAIVGRRVQLPHPNGVVIGFGAVIEDDVWLFQQVTVGSHGRPGEPKSYPIVRRGARLYAGAKVIGGIGIGRNAVVGANAVVTADVPDGATAVGIPAKVLPK